MIENVGNLVCPAAFDLGEAHKVVILSVTEGEDKPLKYPDMFRAADLMLLNKSDLLPYLAFDVDAAIELCAPRQSRHRVIRCPRPRGRAWTSGWPGSRVAPPTAAPRNSDGRCAETSHRRTRSPTCKPARYSR